ncbi:hypothetical protein INP51_10125 [Blautia liquoris]|uniref:Uncharacterized protein n=1 Tax=Blautia liquoris TaxID=2779518 RepID=A0A7M2RDI8_9FIRM|nr:hypothetical protein [Blautia liquoris]QOV18373.1 hypothetical protein INP51_10125 [Blautia liquoris]
MFIQEDSSKQIRANVTFKWDDAALEKTNDGISAQFQTNLIYNSDGENGTSGDHSVFILSNNYTVNIPEEKTDESQKETANQGSKSNERQDNQFASENALVSDKNRQQSRMRRQRGKMSQVFLVLYCHR